ncbi:MAG TPA: nucleoside hydrolase [Phycisphaerae bacterium]|nr:nucleoside hydrolase [Phycisphaerae bacterium]
MGLPVLIDTDMGADDALAVGLALCAARLQVEALVSVAGNVDLDQATTNAGRLLAAVDPPNWPVVGKGLSQTEPDLIDARSVFGEDGFGQAALPASENLKTKTHRAVYRDLLKRHQGQLHIVAIGPLTNVADVLSEQPELLRRAARLTIMGGAIWVRGNVDGLAEFNFYRDPPAARAVLSSGLPITVIPLDLTRQVVFDESHLAHLEGSGTRVGQFLAQVLPYAMQHGRELPPGQMLIHDALAIGSILWPELFLKSELALEIETTGKARGRSRPTVGERGKRVSVLTGVRTVDFLQNMLEQFCQETFVV